MEHDEAAQSLVGRHTKDFFEQGCVEVARFCVSLLKPNHVSHSLNLLFFFCTYNFDKLRARSARRDRQTCKLKDSVSKFEASRRGS